MSTRSDPRIAVYAIALNEARHAARFVAACAGADLVLVADTGSRDDTVAALRDAGAEVHGIAISPWRFDDARNAALALLPRDIDICIGLDLDEVLSPGWAEAVRAAWVPGTTRGTYRHVWTHDAQGAAETEYFADRCHARHGYRWRHACHEAVYPDRISEKRVRIEGMQVDHWPDLSKSRGQYLTLLEATRDEDPGCSRNSFLLGREYVMYKRHADAERELERYLTLPASTWNLQNSAAMRYLAKCRRALGDADGALDWLRRACAAAPDERDAWVMLAFELYDRRDWFACHEAIETGLRQPWRPSSAISDRRSRGASPYDLAAIAAWKSGQIARALAHARRAAELAPADPRLARNVELLAARLAGTEPERLPAPVL